MKQMPEKKHPVKISPSLLSADFSKLGEELHLVEKAGADMIHIDVMDGHFVPNITIGPPVVCSLRTATSLPLDVHLMIENPDNYIEGFAKAGANIITVHVEACRHLHRTIQTIKSFNIQAGVVLNPATPIHLIEEVLGFIDMILIMSVNPGFGGQKFIPSSLDKIEKLKKILTDLSSSVLIEVDGGVTVENSQDIIAAGTDILVAGTAIFKSASYSETICQLKKTE